MKFLIIVPYGTLTAEADSFQDIGYEYPDALAIVRLSEDAD